MSVQENPSVLVLGIGNILWADEGFGVRCVEALDRAHAFPDNVLLMDGGTQGLNLVPAITDADNVLVFDAVDFGAAPGEMVVVRDAEVPSFMGAKKMSLHQTGFQDVLACADLLGQAPDRITLIGVQPVELEDYGGSLTDPVKACIEPALRLGIEELRDWGVTLAARQDIGDQDTVLPEVTLDRYEESRPDALAACRFGDDRVIAKLGLHAMPAREA